MVGRESQVEKEGEQNAQVGKCQEIVNIWEVLGRRWALLILRNLFTKEVIRFNELKRLMPGISSTVLTDRLLELEREGLISKKIYAEIPPKVEYRLTVQARELGILLKEIGRWAQRWKAPRIPAATV
jgi:DNA-binding HxlR family transcriptional regulator